MHLLINAAIIWAIYKANIIEQRGTVSGTICCFTSCREDVLPLLSAPAGDGGAYAAHATIIIILPDS